MATHLGFVRESEVGAKKSINIDNGRVRFPCRLSPRSSYELVSDGADKDFGPTTQAVLGTDKSE